MTPDKWLRLAALLVAPTLAAQPAATVRVFYFGNSLTANTMPAWHAELGASAGKQWKVAWLTGAGAPIWSLRERLLASPEKLEEFRAQPWDAMTLQPFGWWGLEREEKGAERGDIHNASEMIRLFLDAHPRGRVYLYVNWPSMEAVLTGKGKQEREYPDRGAFDYPAQWLKKYDPEARARGATHRTRDYAWRLFEALRARFPELDRERRLRMIPAGDVFFELNTLMRAGRFPGVRDIEELYTDVQHIRSGLPRYTAAAIFYSCLFEEAPAKLDWRIYNDAARYGADPYHDHGEHLAITDAAARLVNREVWRALSAHPYTRLRN